jgi:hypothetical protein
VAVVGAAAMTRAVGGGDRPDLVAERSDVTVAGNTVEPASTSSSTTLAPIQQATTTTTARATTTTTVAAPVASAGGLSGWFAIVQSGPKSGTDREGLAASVAEFGARGHVIDTDAFRTGDGLEPDYFPAPGVYAAVVGSFGSFADARAWCTQSYGDGPCHARQLVPR